MKGHVCVFIVLALMVFRIQKKSDKELWGSIHKGVPNTAMGMWRFVLSDEGISTVLPMFDSLLDNPVVTGTA